MCEIFWTTPMWSATLVGFFYLFLSVVTNMKRRVTITQEIEVPSFKGLPLVGDVELLDHARHCVSLNYNGGMDKIFVNTRPADLGEEWFRPNDKGSLSLFGVNCAGNVIFGMSLFEGDPKSADLEREPHYFIRATNEARHYL